MFPVARYEIEVAGPRAVIDIKAIRISPKHTFASAQGRTVTKCPLHKK